MKECNGCPDRTIEPNCHNPDTCPYWAKKEAEKKKRYAETQERALLSQSGDRFQKGRKMYVHGVYDPKRRVK